MIATRRRNRPSELVANIGCVVSLDQSNDTLAIPDEPGAAPRDLAERVSINSCKFHEIGICKMALFQRPWADSQSQQERVLLEIRLGLVRTLMRLQALAGMRPILWAEM